MKLKIRDEKDANEALLVHEISKHYIRCFDVKAKRLGLTRSQWRLISTVRRNPGIRQAELAEFLDIAPMSLVHLLDRMERKKWLRRENDPSDRRAKKIFLDAKVEPISSKMRKLGLDLRAAALRGFSPAEHEKLLEGLGRVKNNLVRLSEAGKIAKKGKRK